MDRNRRAGGSVSRWPPPCRGGSCAVEETKGGAFVFGDRVQKRVSDRPQIFLGEAESAATACGQASMRESGPHQTPVAMAVQSQEHVAELVSEDPSKCSRIDSVVDIRELLAVPVPIDGARHLLRPKGNAACPQLGMAEPVIVAVSATSVHFEAGRPWLHEHGHERTARVVFRGEVESKLDAARLENRLS